MRKKGIRLLAMLTILTLVAGLLPVAFASEDASENASLEYKMVKDHVPVVVSLGDSFSSGEGANEYYSQNEPIEMRVRDQDWLAHRGVTAWPGLLHFTGKNGSVVSLADVRFDAESPWELPAEQAKWFFAASSGAVIDNLFHSQEKAYSIRVFETPTEYGRWDIKTGESAWTGNLYTADETTEFPSTSIHSVGENPEDIIMDNPGFSTDIASSGESNGNLKQRMDVTAGIPATAYLLNSAEKPKYLTVNELRQYYASTDKKLGIWDAFELMAQELKGYTILEDNATGWDDGKLCGEPLIDPQLNVLNSSIPGGGNAVEYVTLTLSGNDLGFADIVTTAAVDVFEDIVQGVCEFFSDYADWLTSDLFSKIEKDPTFSTKNLSVIFSITSSVVEAHGKLNKMLNDALASFDTEVKERLYTAYKDISARAPNAAILVAGYPKLFDGAASNAIFSQGDIDIINDSITVFNQRLSDLVTEFREKEHIPIYFVSVEEAFEGHGAYSDQPYLTPVLLKAKRWIKAILEVKTAYDWIDNPPKEAIKYVIKKTGPSIMEDAFRPEANGFLQEKYTNLIHFLMLEEEPWPGYDQELIQDIGEYDDYLTVATETLLETISEDQKVSDLISYIKKAVGIAISERTTNLLAASSSMHPNALGHLAYAECVQQYIETCMPIEVTGTVNLTDFEQNLLPASDGYKIVLKLADGPLSEDDERLRDIKKDDKAYPGAIQGEYIIDVKKDGSFSARILAGRYSVEVKDKNNKSCYLYADQLTTTADAHLMHHNSKDMDVRILAMQEVSGRVFAYDEDGQLMDIDLSEYPVRMIFENQSFKELKQNDTEKSQQSDKQSEIVETILMDSISTKGVEYKVKIPVGKTDIYLYNDTLGPILPLYQMDDKRIRLNLTVNTAKKTIRQDVPLLIEDVDLIGRITARDSKGFARDYDLSQYPFTLLFKNEKKKETWTTDVVSKNGTSFTLKMVPGKYTVSLAGQYKKAGYTFVGGDTEMTLSLPIGKPTTKDIGIVVKDQKLSGTLFARTKKGEKTDIDFGKDNPLVLKFSDADGIVVEQYETASIGKRGTAYSIMLPPGIYTVTASDKEGSSMEMYTEDGKPIKVEVPLGASAKSDFTVVVKDKSYLGTWRKEFSVASMFGASADLKLTLNIEPNKITLIKTENTDASSFFGLDIAGLYGLDVDDFSKAKSHDETLYEGRWSETDDGIVMEFDDGNIYFTRLNNDQLLMDIDRLEADRYAAGSADIYLIELLRVLSYTDMNSLFGIYGDYGDMMDVDSPDDIFVFTRTKDK